MRRDCLSLANSYEKKEKAAILRDTGQLSSSCFGAVAHSCCSGQSRIEWKSSDIPQNVPRLPAALEVVSVYPTAFSWSHFPELVHDPVSQSKYVTTTASSDKEVHGLTSFCVSFCFFWTLFLPVSWDVSQVLWCSGVKQLFPIYFSLPQF